MPCLYSTDISKVIDKSLTALNSGNAAARFDGVFDLRPLVDAVELGRVLNPIHLDAVASTLQVCQYLTAQFCI